ncbi:MAG: pilus assembly protein PilP [Smithellaceae bacterium]
MKKIKLIILCNLLILFTVAVSVYCAEAINPPQQALPATPSTIDTAPMETKAPLPVPQILPAPDGAYSYNPLGKPDPFKPYVNVDITAAQKEKEKKAESIFPLQRAEIESFKLVGIVGDQANKMAVIQDSAKKFYPVFIGTRIGLHNGKVTGILADQVTIDELDGNKVRKIVLKLRKN